MTNSRNRKRRLIRRWMEQSGEPLRDAVITVNSWSSQERDDLKAIRRAKKALADADQVHDNANWMNRRWDLLREQMLKSAA